jgi:hypothetical protein
MHPQHVTLTVPEMIAILTALSAFIFPQLQIISLRHQLALSTLHEEVGIVSMVGDVFLKAPDLRPYFYDGLDLPDDDPKANQAKVVAEAICDAFALLILSWKRATNIPHTRPGQEQWIKDIYHCSPVLRRYYAEREGWYPREMTRFLERHCGYESSLGRGRNGGR